MLDTCRRALCRTLRTSAPAGLTREVSELTESSRSSTKQCKGLLEELKRMGVQLRQGASGADPRGQAQYRLFQNRYHAMFSIFHKAVSDNQVARATFKERVTERAVSQAKLLFPDKSDEELSSMVTSNPQALEQHLQAPEVVAHAEVQDVYDEVQERNQAINELVRSIKEINDMMSDLAVLVQEQSEQLQRIDAQVGSAVVRIEKGNKELERAIQYQKAARRKYCCIAIVGVVILLVIVGSVIPATVSRG